MENKKINLLKIRMEKVDKNKDTLKESTKMKCISTALKILKLYRLCNMTRKIIPQSSGSWNKISGELSSVKSHNKKSKVVKTKSTSSNFSRTKQSK